LILTEGNYELLARRNDNSISGGGIARQGKENAFKGFLEWGRLFSTISNFIVVDEKSFGFSDIEEGVNIFISLSFCKQNNTTKCLLEKW